MAGLPSFDSVGSGKARGVGLDATVVNLKVDSGTIGLVVRRGGRVVARALTDAMR
jgi:hypothetical protein